MRCPERGEGILYQCRAKLKNGEYTTVFVCDEADDSWAGEVCRERAISFDDIIEYEEASTEVDPDNRREKGLSFEVYHGWEKSEVSELACPYCRTQRLIHGITKQTQREIYECSRCGTIWIGSVFTENISNYRKYDEECRMIPDENEIDIGGKKYPALFEAEKTTAYICPKCRSNIQYGRLLAVSPKIEWFDRAYFCAPCKSVWINEPRYLRKPPEEKSSPFQIENGVLKKYTEEPGITRVIVPDGVTAIDAFAFCRCSHVTHIMIPKSVSKIADTFFSQCESLTQIVVSVNNGSYCSKNGALLTKDGKTLLRCPGGIEDFVVPEGVTTAAVNAFSQCLKLTNITISDDVISFEPADFYYDPTDFHLLKNLTDITVSEHNRSYCSIGGVLFTKDKETLLCCPPGKSSFTIPDGVKQIGKDAFANCDRITEIRFPETLETIKANAFYCSGITAADIPESVTVIERSAFYCCFDLKKVQLPGCITEIADHCFAGDAELREIQIPEGVTRIGAGAFRNCRKLQKVSIPGSVTEIGVKAFDHCFELTGIDIPYGVTSISSVMFGSCKNLEHVTIPDSITSIGAAAFAGCVNLKQLTIPKSVTNIDFHAFSWI